MEWLDGGRIGRSMMGKKLNMVLSPCEFDDTSLVVAWKTHRGQLISLDSSIDMKGFETATIYGFQVVDVSEAGNVSLIQGTSGHLFRNLAKENGSWSTFLSLCSGMGGGILGVDSAGFTCVGALDRSALATESLVRNFDFPVHCGSVEDTNSLIAMHKAKGESSYWVEAGFPCQPFSTLGDNRGFGDDRAWTLVSILKAGWLLQIRGIVLECVPGAAKNNEVSSFLNEISEVMGWQRSETVLHLERAWPCRRSRWWAMLYPKQWQSIELEDMPSLPQWHALRSLFTAWPWWTPEEEEVLTWNADEVAIFKDPAFGSCDRRLSLSGPAPTLLHSMGNHTMKCPCGCRAKAFTLDRLSHGGAHVVEVISGPLGGLSRHLHPREASLLQGVHDGYQHDPDLRGALCLLGQIASPLQGEWIGLHLRQSIANEIGCFSKLEVPMWLLLEERCDTLAATAKNSWLAPECLDGGSCTIRQWPGIDVEIRFVGGQQISDIICAQEDLSRGDDKWNLSRDGILLTPQAYLRPGVYYASTTSSTLSLASSGTTEVFFHLGEQIVRHQGLRTEFLFQFLSDDCKHWVHDFVCMTDDGQVFPWSRKVGTNSVFKVVPVIRGAGDKLRGVLTRAVKDEELQLLLKLRHANGNAPPLDEGLDDVTISCVMRTMFKDIDADQTSWLEPRTVIEWLKLPHSLLVFTLRLHFGEFKGNRVLAILGDDAHWAVVDYQKFPQGSELAYIDGIPDRLLGQAEKFGSALHKAIGIGPFNLTKASCFLQDGGDQCGAVALLHLGWRLNFWPRFDSNDVNLWYRSLRWGVREPTVFGGGFASNDEALQTSLGALLTSKGADPAQVTERIQGAIRMFGQAKLENALKAKNPWQALKALGSNRSKQYQWITYNELQNHIEARGRQKWGADIDQKKPVKSKKETKGCEFLLDPMKLQLLEGFWTNGSTPLEQIEFLKVKASGTGVAFCKIEDALPYLQAGSTISVDALMLLTVGQLQDVQSSLRFEHIEVPAKYAGTGEPVVIKCTAIQLGDVDAVLADENMAHNVSTCPTEVVRLHWFRDECYQDWNEVCRRPIKLLVESVPLLALCRSSACTNCSNFHPTVEEEGIDSVLIDLWSWKWVSLDGRKQKPYDAEVLQLYIRCPESALTGLIEASGDHGLYFEPRQSTGFGPHQSYSIVWLAGGNLKTAQHAAKTDEQIIGIARLGSRFGLRTTEKNAEKVHQRHCPQKPFLKGNITQIYRLEPLPIGTQRSSLGELLQQYGWSAKPLQAARGSHGRAWEIGTAVEPPAEVLRTQEGYVTITKVKDYEHQPRTEQVIASQKTKNHIRREAVGSNDTPWAPEGDPWAQWRKQNLPQSSAPAIPAGEAKTKIDEVEKRLKQNVEETVKTQINEIAKDVGNAESSTRLDKLEVQLGELQNQSARFENYFIESQKTTANHQQCITELQELSVQQTTTVNQLKTVVENCTTQIGQQQQEFQTLSADFGTFKNGLNNHLESLFTKQMSHIETLLEKSAEADAKRHRPNP